MNLTSSFQPRLQSRFILSITGLALKSVLRPAERMARLSTKLQPPTPTKEDLDLLDVEVEENLKTKILIQDDFSSAEADPGVSVFKRLSKVLSCLVITFCQLPKV